MNLAHLGDALDFWKGGLFRILDKALNDMHVLPMFTDKNVHDAWTNDRIRAYASLLGVDKARILCSKDPFPGTQRENYFQNLGIGGDRDIFVDPDTGIEPDSGGDHQHIRQSEIEALLPSDSRRVLLVYQHSSRKREWLKSCLEKVCASNEFHAFAYCAGTIVAMVFIARRGNRRLKEMHQRLHTLTCSFPAEPLRLTEVVP